jgi:hypothetical protein
MGRLPDIALLDAQDRALEPPVTVLFSSILFARTSPESQARGLQGLPPRVKLGVEFFGAGRGTALNLPAALLMESS